MWTICCGVYLLRVYANVVHAYSPLSSRRAASAVIEVQGLLGKACPVPSVVCRKAIRFMSHCVAIAASF